jgi:hypothetical protein
MKNLIIAIGITLLSSSFFAQDKSYVILDKAEVVDINLYITAIEKATWDKYRLVDERRSVTFKEGVKIELLSANEMTEKGLEIDLSKVMKQASNGKYQPLFVLSDSGFIMEQHSYQTKRKQ